MTINEGGTLEMIAEGKLEDVKFTYDTGESIQLWLNGSSLSYLTINEAIALKRELDEAIKNFVYRGKP